MQKEKRIGSNSSLEVNLKDNNTWRLNGQGSTRKEKLRLTSILNPFRCSESENHCGIADLTFFMRKKLENILLS